MTDTPDLEVPDPDLCLYIDATGRRCLVEAVEVRLMSFEPGVRAAVPICEEHYDAPTEEASRERMLMFLEESV